MIHYMTLVNWAFEAIKNKTKTIEMRLNDEKRSKIKMFDEIEFTNIETHEKVYAYVKKIHLFSSFEELYNHFDKIQLGYSKDEIASYTDMEQFYSQEKILKYGVVGIEIELLEKGKSQIERINNTIDIFKDVLGEDSIDTSLKYEIVSLDSFKLIGYKRRFNNKTGYYKIPQFWDEIIENNKNIIDKYKIGQLAICIESDNEEFDYMIAGYYYNEDNKENLEIIEIPALKWIKFTCLGAMPEAIQNLSFEVFNRFFKENTQYEIKENYNIEYYSDGDNTKDTYVSQIWVPIK